MPDGRTEHDRITDLAIQVERYAHVTNTELRALRQGQEQLDGRMDRLDIRMDRMEVRMDRLEEGQAQLRREVTELRTDVTDLRKDVNEIREGQKQLGDVMNENFRQLFVLLNTRPA
ncbi:hypothetical protein [Azospirillum sp. sgz302134]